MSALLLFAQLVISGPTTNAAVKPALKCEQYQHEQVVPAHCANTCPTDPETQGYGCTAQCLWMDRTDQCVDDMHSITERDWQNLMTRLDTLERSAEGSDKNNAALELDIQPSGDGTCEYNGPGPKGNEVHIKRLSCSPTKAYIQVEGPRTK